MFDLSMAIKAQVHRDNLLEDAGIHRLYKMAQADRPRPQEHLLLSIGDALISLGLRLKARYQSDSAVPILRAGQQI
jgi:hypothetical protein